MFVSKQNRLRKGKDLNSINAQKGIFVYKIVC